MLDIGIGEVVGKHRRWYERLFSSINTDSRWNFMMEGRSESLEQMKQVGKLKIVDLENLVLDVEKQVIYGHGFIPVSLGIGSNLKEELYGSSLLWSFVYEKDRGSIRQQVEEQLKSSNIEILMHGHSAMPGVFADELQEKEVGQVKLSLGLMGAEGMTKTDQVYAGETSSEQVRDCLKQLGIDKDMLPNFDQRVNYIIGHSMQGYTILEMVANKEIREKFKRALFVAAMPVIRGSNYDTPDDVHVYLHAGIKGMLVKMLPPMVMAAGKTIGRWAVDKVNKLGVFSQVLGPYIREQVLAGLHFVEIERSPEYLSRVNKLLGQMPDLRSSNFRERLIEAGLEGNVVIAAGEKDAVLNSRHMLELAELTGIPVWLIENTGHYPWSSDGGVNLGFGARWKDLKDINKYAKKNNRERGRMVAVGNDGLTLNPVVR